jgi:hypothetical protein
MKAGKTCFNCEKKGHFALQCPNRRQQPIPSQGMTPPSNHIENSSPMQDKQNCARGIVSQVAMQEAQNAPSVATRTLLINSNLVLTVPWSLCFSSLRISGRDSF